VAAYPDQHHTMLRKRASARKIKASSASPITPPTLATGMAWFYQLRSGTPHRRRRAPDGGASRQNRAPGCPEPKSARDAGQPRASAGDSRHACGRNGSARL